MRSLDRNLIVAFLVGLTGGFACTVDSPDQGDGLGGEGGDNGTGSEGGEGPAVGIGGSPSGGNGSGGVSSGGRSSGGASGGSAAGGAPANESKGALAVDTGYGHTCVLLPGGRVRCWGDGSYGELGYGNTEWIGDDEYPSSAGDVDVGGTVIQIATGTQHTCALLSSGKVRCWGRGPHGQLGYGNTEDIGDDETPASAGDIDVGGTVTQIAAGNEHTCALLTGGTVRCWGLGVFGRLGYGNTDNIGDDETPASAGDIDVGATVTQIAAGAEHTCAILAGGNVLCWGSGGSGVLGKVYYNNLGDDELPSTATVIDIGGTVEQVTSGANHNCALMTGGTVRCWGWGHRGRLGYGDEDSVGDNETPASKGDVDVGGTVTQVAAGSEHTCVLLTSSNVRCWGYGMSDALGYGNTDTIGDNEAPSTAGDVDIGGTVTQIAVGYASCALLEEGNVRCWGAGISGVLGHGDRLNIGDDEAPTSAGDIPFL